MQRPKTYTEWEGRVPNEMQEDSLWKVTAYRLSLFVGDLGWHDFRRLTEARLWGIADQLYRSLGSVSANIAEGYSRSTGPDRARFFEYALGSTRESREWYYKARHVLGDEIFRHRLEVLTRIIQLLIKTIPDQRRKGIRELNPPYALDKAPVDLGNPIPYPDHDS